MLKTVSFYGTCAAGSELVLVSDVIGHPYLVKAIRCSFPVGSINKVELQFFIAEDDDPPSTGLPNGLSILADYGHVPYVVGEGEVVKMLHEVEVRIANTWLKVHANNRDFAEHAVNVQITIDIEDRG